MPQKVVINFKAIREIAEKPIQRAAAFLGLGLNAAYDENFKKYQLTPSTQLEILPSNLNDESISNLKKEFSIWIIAGGLNELIEGFEGFLRKIHLILLLIKLRNGGLSHEEARKERKKFSYGGLKEKLRLLRENHSLIYEDSLYLESLACARNCFTHRHGIVGQGDPINDESELTIEWRAMDVFIQTSEGEEISIIPSKGRKEIYTKSGGTVKLRFNVLRTLKFSKGQMINLSPHDLAEICLFVRGASKVFIDKALGYVKEHGIPKEKRENENRF